MGTDRPIVMSASFPYPCTSTRCRLTFIFIVIPVVVVVAAVAAMMMMIVLGVVVVVAVVVIAKAAMVAESSPPAAAMGVQEYVAQHCHDMTADTIIIIIYFWIV